MQTVELRPAPPPEKPKPDLYATVSEQGQYLTLTFYAKSPHYSETQLHGAYSIEKRFAANFAVIIAEMAAR